MKVAIVGGSAAGMFASLLLARAGHDVVLLEQERAEPAEDLEAAAAAAFRPSAPQIVQPHIVMARCRDLLRRLLPDVYVELLRAGVVEVPIAAQMPDSLTDRSPWPGDDLMTMLATRRATVDWVLRRAVAHQAGVAVRYGERATGLLATAVDPPRVDGVRTEMAEVLADVVIDASGRRSRVDEWLGDIGARPAAKWAAECGVAYYSRHYRLRPRAELPGLPTTRQVVGLPEFTAGIWGGDNGSMQIAVVPLAVDRRFRSLNEPEVFTAVLRTMPAYARWLDALDPITPVFQMAGLHNTLRRLVADGVPVATHLHLVGDSVCTTNPTLGRGLSIAMVGAADVADVLAHHPDDWVAQALAMDGRVQEHVTPFYEDQAAIDQERLAALRHAVFADPLPPPAATDGERVTYAQLRAAAPFDPTAYRGFWRVQSMIEPPENVYRDPAVVARTLDVLADPPAPPRGPSREELLSALAGSRGSHGAPAPRR